MHEKQLIPRLIGRRFPKKGRIPMMKNRLARWLAVLLCLCLMPLPALAEGLDDTVEPTLSGGTPQRLFSVKGHMYALVSWAGMYEKVEGGWQPALMFSDGNVSMECLDGAAAEEEIYLLARSYEDDSYSIQLTTVLDDGRLTGLEPVCEVNLGIGEDVYPQLCGMATDGESLWVLLYADNSGMDWGNNSLYRISLSDGSATLVTKNYFSGLTLHADGRLLTRYWNQQEAYSTEEIIMPALALIDPASGEYETLCSLPSASCTGIAVDGEYVYLSDTSHVYRYDASFAAPELVAYLTPVYSSDNTAALVFGGQYYVASWDDESGVKSTSTDPSLLPSTVLRIAGGFYDTELLGGFCAAHPEIAVELEDTYYYQAEDIRQNMTSGDSACDLYALYFTEGSYDALRRKGYCADLSSSETLMAAVDSMYPFVQDVLTQDGKLHAVPLNVSATTLGYYTAALDKVGLTTDDLPTSLWGLLDFIEVWYEDYADEYPEIQLFEYSTDDYSTLLNLIFEAQMAACDREGTALTLDTPVVSKLLSRLEQLKPILQEMSSSDGETMVFDADSPGALFSSYADCLPNRYGHNPAYEATPLLLSLDEGMEPALHMNLSGMILNPASKNAEAAITFLEYVVEHMPADRRIALEPGYNEPLEYEYYASNKKNIADWISEMEESMANASEEEKAMYEDNIQYARESLQSLEDERWAVDEEDIAAYRSLAVALVVPTSNPFYGESAKMTSLLQRFSDGQLSADQFVKEFSRIYQMIEMENQ